MQVSNLEYETIKVFLSQDYYDFGEIKELDSSATRIRAVVDLKPYTLRLQDEEPEEHVSPTRSKVIIGRLF